MYVINRMLTMQKCCQLSMLPVVNCQLPIYFITEAQRLRVSFHNLVNPVNPVKKLCLSAFVPSVDGKQLFETTCLWRTGELARVHFPSQNRMDMLRWSRKSAGKLSRAPLQSCFYKLSKLFPILNRMGENCSFSSRQNDLYCDTLFNNKIDIGFVK